MNFDKIKYYYDNNLWNIPMVRMAVQKGIITKMEYFLIIGQDY